MQTTTSTVRRINFEFLLKYLHEKALLYQKAGELDSVAITLQLTECVKDAQAYRRIETDHDNHRRINGAEPGQTALPSTSPPTVK